MQAIAITKHVADQKGIWASLIIFLLLMQSFGIRALPMQGTLINCAIIGLACLKFGPRLLPRQAFWGYGLIVLLLYSLNGRSPHLSNIIVDALIIMAAAFAVLVWMDNRVLFEKAFAQVALFISLHALLSVVVFALVPSLFSYSVVNYMPHYVAYPLICTPSAGFFPARAAGLMWEPGILQFIATLGYLVEFRKLKSALRLAGFVFTILATFSTTGYINLVLLLVYSLVVSLHFSGKALFRVLVILILAGLVFPFVHANVIEKTSGVSTSGLTRQRDLAIGLALIAENPWWGIGSFNSELLARRGDVQKIEYDLLGDEYVDDNGAMAGGFTNGLLIILLSLGLPLGLMILWGIYKNALFPLRIQERITFLLVFLTTSFSEPIFPTVFIFALVFSGLLFSRKPEMRTPA